MAENHLIQISDLSLYNIEKVIKEEHLNYYDYKKFSHIEQIGIGGFGKVYRADWKNGLEQRLALKSFYNLNNDILKEIIHEVNINYKLLINIYLLCFLFTFYIFYLRLNLNEIIKMLFVAMGLQNFHQRIRGHQKIFCL
ncbi:hypothetical protein GLOIN_2v1155248 [Rhizophagus irregularis DAOM 181602=DAOM 197198]|uniref:Protein kinase domain-containing protein n=1 Tax=Rhizophagus irregularis (strain DAOM 181602 / DAOM 197198 / MUCL 43194) TaxID=747089 RepID=A0A2P4Q4J7_RHIID|nr:hypothetical protein GLOIN_2v1155248 [Rhizophagus irregularis DAOM 181602=DAOM 197198]POG72581.1 hypothetical protein GLOIN_2v1155248 [Rhizophagus irregularis DAOM 181602=DAOM 197198]|eukprot:XP_025179447.1 hypothetical protein GLOIN_2v1155248 [Rhizophagus irregularis DAOM 181602=DAOM 197198]